MRNLNTETWNNFFESKEHYLAYRAKWSELTRKAQKGKIKLTATDYLTNAILRGKDWKKGFAIPKQGKRQGYDPCCSYGGAIGQAFNGLKRGLEKFDGLITSQMIDRALSYVNVPSTMKQFESTDSYKGVE